MNSYSFTIVLAKVDDYDLAENLLYEKCSDALLSRVNDTVMLDFDREASSQEIAIQTAYQDIAHAGYKVSACRFRVI